MKKITTIAALFVESDGVYQNIDGIECWDVKRDARKYKGPYPVIAHPPCQKWGKMARVNYARWVETLMGLPVGWTMPSADLDNPPIDQVDNRTDELRLCGNGVVPQSAEAAFILFIEQQFTLLKEATKKEND